MIDAVSGATRGRRLRDQGAIDGKGPREEVGADPQKFPAYGADRESDFGNVHAPRLRGGLRQFMIFGTIAAHCLRRFGRARVEARCSSTSTTSTSACKSRIESLPVRLRAIPAGGWNGCSGTLRSRPEAGWRLRDESLSGAAISIVRRLACVLHPRRIRDHRLPAADGAAQNERGHPHGAGHD